MTDSGHSTAAQLQTLMSDRCHVTRSLIIEFCQRWQVTEFALFGSVLRDDFRDDSDIDVLVTLAPNHGLNLLARTRSPVSP